MSREAQTWFRTIRIGLSPVEKLIGGELAYRAEDDTHRAWPTLKRLVDDTEVPKRTVQRALDVLQERGLIRPVGRHERTRAVVYELAVNLRIEARVPTVAGDSGQIGHAVVASSPDPGHAEADEFGHDDAEQDGQNGPDFVVKTATMGMAKMASTNSLIENHTIQSHKAPFALLPAADEGPARKKASVPLPLQFDDWWAAYPRKTGKDAARKAYASAIKRGATDADLLAGLKRYRFSPDPQYQPHPATWLNQGRWQDEAPAQAPPVPDTGRPAPAVAAEADADAWGWRAWARSQPDAALEACEGGQEWAINGHIIPVVVARVCKAAGIPPEARPKLDAVGAWMREDYLIDADVQAAIGEQAERMQEEIRSLAAFDRTVRTAGRRLADVVGW